MDGWLKEGLLLLDTGKVGGTFGAAWNWHFGFDIHAGEHLTGAMRAIYFIRRRYLNQDDDEGDDRPEGSGPP